MAMRESRVLHQYGVELSGLRYNTRELGYLRSRLNFDEKVQVRYRDELGYIWIYDQFAKEFQKVPCTNKEAMGLSRDLYGLARKKAGESGTVSVSFDRAYAAYRKLFSEVESAKKSNKLRVRRYAARLQTDPDGQLRSPADTEAEAPDITKLPFAIDWGNIKAFDMRSNNTGDDDNGASLHE